MTKRHGGRTERGIVLHFFLNSSAPRLGRFTLGKKKATLAIVEEAGWLSELAWTGAENLFSTAIRKPKLSARRESLCCLRYPGRQNFIILVN
jgi:hypothetical protein